jgi:hypothetical protein
MASLPDDFIGNVSRLQRLERELIELREAEDKAKVVVGYLKRRIRLLQKELNRLGKITRRDGEKRGGNKNVLAARSLGSKVSKLS